MNKKILVTGASGFIGNPLCNALSALGKSVNGTVRSKNTFKDDKNIKFIKLEDINSNVNWKELLVDVDCVIHCAGKTHIMKQKEEDDQKIYRSVNVDGTKKLAKKAVDFRVKRFIFLSSIKVNGESTSSFYSDKILNKQKKNIFTNNDTQKPEDSYAKSKSEAEKVLWEISSRSSLEVVIVRLPLVYGYGVKGNLARLIKIVKSGIPLPLSKVNNQRSMIGIDNLIDLLIRCIDHSEANGKTFLASDGEDLSTPELIKLIASSIGKRTYLFPLPVFLLNFLSSIFGKQKEIESLRIDNSYTKEILNWKPTLSVEEGIKRMIQGK